MKPASNESSPRASNIEPNVLTDEQSLAAAINEDVLLHPHDARWSHAFELERARLHALFPGTFTAIEHIGSTAIPGLVAKPIIDLMAGVVSLGDVDVLVDRLCDNGYTTSTDFNASLTDRKWLMRWRDGHRTHHLHIVVHGGNPWRDRVVFRDALRRDTALAARYAILKTDLAARHRSDRETYTDAKAAFVAGVVAAAQGR